MNGQQYARSGVWYTYQAAAWVRYLSPSSALSEGGTPLTVHGGGFSSASEALGVLTCRIGGARCAARCGRARARARVQRDARCGGRVARRGEQQRARVHVERRALRLVSVRVLDVQPWSGPVGGATVVSVRAHGAWPGGCALPLGDGAASAGWRRRRVAAALRDAAEQRRRERAGWACSCRASTARCRAAAASTTTPSWWRAARRRRSARSAAARACRCSAAASATRTRCAARLAARRRRCSRGTSTSRSSSARRRCTRRACVGVLLSMNGQQYAPSGASYTYQRERRRCRYTLAGGARARRSRRAARR